MDQMIYNPMEEYEKKFHALHLQHTEQFFADLVKRSGVDAEQNRETIRQYVSCREGTEKLRKKLNFRRFLRVIMCITVVLIPLVILKVSKKIRAMREELAQIEQRAEALLQQAHEQMRPLNALFTQWDALRLIEKTIPMVSFEPTFSAKQEEDMRLNYDFVDEKGEEQSTVDVLAGHYNENPFLFENKLLHIMGIETYHGYKTIRWTETYRDSDGKTRTRVRTETLHATVTKPKPFYNTQVVLNYCAQGGPDLTFGRDATNLDEKNARQLERYVKRGEKKLKKKAEQALKTDDDFVSMSNTEFEVLFDALNRSDEVQFRTLFTPLAQTNMVDLLLSQVGYGDDFHFFKDKRTNRIISNHSQGRMVKLLPDQYVSYDFDEIQRNFIGKNTDFFKAVYFDFAPVWAIPIYQERPVHSLKPIPDLSQRYALKECEALANRLSQKYVVHPDTKTQAILKATFVGSKNEMDETCITAYSYDIEKRVDIVSVRGGDGHWHNVPVDWDEYLPLEMENHFYITKEELVKNQTVLASRNGLCIFSK